MNEKERVENLLKKYGFAAKKSFGQNFLISDGIINRIVNHLDISSFDSVIEIGPGLGSLTLPISLKSKKLYAVDADRDMVKVLSDLFKGNKNVTIIESDFLKFNPDEYSNKSNRLFVGNLPYNITSELLEYLLEKKFLKAGVMVQKEVSDKLIYTKGKKENTALGAYIDCVGELSILTYVDKSCFLPVPKVDSAFIVIDYQKDIPFEVYPVFKAMFKDPNKTIANCLKQFQLYKEIVKELSDKYPFILEKRARQLSSLDLLNVAETILEILK